jgi:cytosine permease
MLPDYITKASPNPLSNRAPWYANTAPSYAGIFLWIAFYQSLAQGTIEHAGLGVCVAALVVAGFISYGLFYLVPGLLGMQTGYPLYVVGSSTFGTAGGYLMPGLLMGLLQLGWFAVSTFFSAKFLLAAFGSNAGPNTVPFAIVAVLWGYVMAYIGVKGIQYVAKVSTILNFIPLVMILIVFFRVAGGIGRHTPPAPDSFIAFTMLIQLVVGFFATAGAAGVDFGLNSRNARDVRMGGLVGIALAIVVAGGLPIASVAGARALDPSITSYNYDAVIGSIGGFLASAMFLLFTLACVTPNSFCAFIASNSFATMLPGVPRMTSTMIGVTVSIVLAITGAAADLQNVFGIVGASFGPICGAMAADYLLSGRRWAGPRAGINWAGYIAWAVGFIVGIIPFPFMPLPQEVKTLAQPAAVYSFIAGFLVYCLLAKAGLQPKTVELTAKPAA